MKKFSVFYIFLAFILTLSCYNFFTKKEVFAIKENVTQIDVQSKEAILMDAKTNTVVYGYNERDRKPIASMCKVMTLLLCFEAIDRGEFNIDDLITVSENASSMGGSQVFLESNAEYPVSELLKSIVVASANDSCVAMAEKICGSEELFVEKMNLKACELQMNDTNFTNCTGLPKAGQYSCARDVAIMFSELIKHNIYFDYSNIWMDEINHPKNRITQISNTNKLIKYYNGCDAGKTGYTSEAGHCLTASALRDNTRLIAVVIGAPDSKTRFKEVSNLFNYGFANFTTKTIVDKNEKLNLDVKISGGKKEKLTVKPSNSLYIFTPKNEKRAIEIDFIPLKKIVAPINKGTIVGKLVVYENSKEILSTNVISDEKIEKETYFDVIYKVIKNWSIAS